MKLNSLTGMIKNSLGLLAQNLRFQWSSNLTIPI